MSNTVRLKQDNILIANEGPDKNVLLLTPPMCFSIPDAEHVIQKVDKYLLEIESSVCPDELIHIGQTPIVQPTELVIPRNIISGAGDSDSDDAAYGDDCPAKRSRHEHDYDDLN